MTSGNARQDTAAPSRPQREPGKRQSGQNQASILPSSLLLRAALWLALWVVLIQALGCGNGINGISGGSIPTGGSRLTGRAVTAEDPRVPISNATVSVQTTVPGQAPQTLQVTTDAEGNFAFPQVPTGSVNSRVQVTVRAPDSLFRPLALSFLLTNQRPATLIAALPASSFDVARGTSVTIMPPAASVHVGDTIVFTAQVRDRAGNVLPIMPSLLFDGDFGTLNADGTFTGTGTGSIVAYWYGGITSAAQVTSNETTPSSPPPPPPVFPPEKPITK